MEILILLIPLSVVLALVAGGLFVLMNRGGQFDDLESPGYGVIADDDRVVLPTVDLDQGVVAGHLQQCAIEKEGLPR